MKIAVIGTGRVGTSLGNSWPKPDMKSPAWPTPIRRLRRARRIIGRGRVFRDPVAALRSAEVILIAVPDDALAGLASVLQPGNGTGEVGKTLLHTSGAAPAAILAPLAKRSAAVGSMHPAQSFPTPSDAGLACGA